MPTSTQQTLSFGPVHNVGLFSSHWLDHRLELEPEWQELRDEARDALERLAELWKVQRNRVERYGDEQGLEEGFIQPVLRTLAWQLKYQTFVQGREPDYALFLDDAGLDAALATGRTSADFWATAKVVADAKAWHVSLDRPVRVQNQREYPPQQIEWYLDRTRLDWGMLTNGKLWRLVPRQLGSHQRRFQTYLEVDLPAILNAWLSAAGNFTEQSSHLDDFLRFYLFFGPAGYRETAQRKPLLRRANEGSSEYRLSVGEDLKGQTFEALRVCIEGFLGCGPNELNPDDHLLLCREQSFILLCRLLFIMYAEDRRLLPYKVNRLYTENRSLGRLRDDVARRIDRSGSLLEDDFHLDSTALWDDLEALFDLIDRGHARYGVAAYNGGLFDIEAHPFLTEKKLSDWHLARVIDHLGRAKDPKNPSAGLSRVDYRDLAIQHLGGIYEGLLELHPLMAAERMLVWTRRVRGVREEIVKAESEGTPTGYDQTDIAYAPGSVYLITDKGERRAFGSYYTPDHIVDAIIRGTVGPICDALSRQLQDEVADCRTRLAKATGAERQTIAETLTSLERSYPERVLRLRLLDPAMGSSHFLLRACQFLAEEIATNPFTESDHAPDGDGESALAYWKRRAVESCIYGVDLNPLAVELAKLALWLETVAADRPLTFLDHHLRHGNSLIGAKVVRLRAHPGEELGMFEDVFGQELARKLPAFLKPLTEIRRSSSESLEQVKAKQAAYTAFAKAVTPFRQVADLWCAAIAKAELTPQQYHQALDVVDKLNRFKKVAESEWFAAALRKAQQDMACCHWELEFPEVFFDESGSLARPGFDAVIGNPPYEVLSELESGQDLSNLRAFIDAEPSYAPSQRGKNNLYKLFICRALDLLADGGRLGFITPMAVLGDDQAADLRREMVRQGAFTVIEAFPQKDDPSRRVFPEAKLSTAVFVLQKGGIGNPFRARVHPGRLIEVSSPGLALTTESIPLYDPSNFTIVSCDQADWDLAVRIMQSGRMGRLGDVAESFQGEVNETNDRKAGRISYDSRSGPEVIRGAHLCLYAIREASQGRAVFLIRDRFLDRGAGADRDLKAFHHIHRRVGFQRKSPQNNFRRLVAAMIEPGTFLLESVSYIPEHRSNEDLYFVLGLLNSKLADWYFRLGSTNAMVSEYQVNNLPCPLFAASLSPKEAQLQKRAEAALPGGRPEEALEVLRPLLAEPPFSPAIRQVIIAAVQQIMKFEADRGEIARTERSALATAAQPYQDLIDRLFFGMAGLSDEEVKALEVRYAKML
jgi:hypothetical protein